MKRNFKKPFWIGASAVLATAAVVAPAITLSSCSVIESYMIDEMDHETGNTSALYNSMKKEFRVKYINKLKYEELLSDDEIAEKLVIFDDFLQKEDEMLTKNTADNIAVDYTMLTSTLSEVASLQYGITLNRRCNVDFDDYISEYQGLRVATKTYLINHGISEPKAERQMKDCDKNFDKLMTKISKEYSYDPFMGVIKGQTELIALFNANNAEAALVASMNRLNDFVQQYTFEFSDNAPSYAYYDNLKLRLTVGDDIPDPIMNEVFDMKEVQTGDPSTFDRYKSAPGYVLTPYLHGWYSDPYKNEYGMEIDWRIYPSVYDDKEKYTDEDRRLVTAHVYGRNDKVASESFSEDDFTFNESIVGKADGSYTGSEIQTTRYILRATSGYEKANLVDTYLDENDSEHVCFAWQGGAQNDKNKYEAFFDGIPQGSDTGVLGIDSLANSGLRISSNGISFEDLSDVITRMNAEQKKTEDVRPDSDLTLAELFVKYCTFKSKVTVIDQYGSDHKVSHQFFYKYGNSQYGDESVLYEEQPRRSDGFKISKKFFTIANEKFCETYYMFKAYQDNDFVEIKKNCNSLTASFASTSIGTAIQIGVNVIHLIFGGFTAKVIAGYVIALLTSNAVVLGIEWPFYIKYLVTPIDDYIERVKKLRRYDCFKAMEKRLSDDRQYFCLPKTTGIKITLFNITLYSNQRTYFPQQEYNDKMDAFRTASFVEHSRPLFQYYSTVMSQQEFIEFRQATIKEKVDPKKFKETFGSWMYTGYHYLACYGYCGVRWVINKLIMPKEKTIWLLWLLEFAAQVYIGQKITEALEQSVFKYEYNGD